MTKRMLIDAAHPEETRVVIVNTNQVEELDFESRHKRQLRGNVYLARVTRVEPSLQAAFIEYGGNRHGFLAFSEIHPDYYKIPEADKQALKEQEEEDQRQAEEEEEKRKAAKAKRNSRTKKDETFEDEDEDEDDDQYEDDDEDEDLEDDEDDTSEASDEEDEDEDEHDEEEERDENLDPDDDDATDEDDAEVADEQVKVVSKRRKRISRRKYKIQEVIKRGQILLVQAVKEERGNKGAAMTTYLSLAGRYCVLMPNTPRGGGISRKIANGSDRKRLKTIMNDLKVPQGMGVIVRTAGAKRNKTEIERDYEYLSRLWTEIRDTTMESSAPALIHEEGNLVKRSIRDLYTKEIEEVLVQGDDAYKTAKNFIQTLMPSHAKFVKHYDDDLPLFLRYGAEKQIENSLEATVQLKSGGYLVIHPTEALISVDVNSGRSTKERNIERTALKTNLEAAEELARQMRLRDLAGLIVVDFIDMDENKNNRAVERKMKDVLSRDRARIQTSRISQFGLMEISRQRRRRSLLEGSTTICPHCEGVGRQRTVESSALAAIRAVEEFAVRGKAKRIRLKTSQDVAHYLLNEKRDLLTQVDQITDVFTEVVGDDSFIRPQFELEVVEKRTDKRKDPLVKIEQDFKKEKEAAKRKTSKKAKKADNDKAKDDEDRASSDEDSDESEDENRRSSRRRSRRGRRGGRGRGRSRRDENRSNEDNDDTMTADALAVIDPNGDSEAKTPEIADDDKPKRKGRRKSKSKDADTDSDAGSEKRSRSGRRAAPKKTKDVDVAEEAPTEDNSDKKPISRSSARRKAPGRKPKTDATSELTPEVKTDSKASTSRKRKAPSKTKAKAKSDKATETKAKPTRTRKAPSKTAKSKAEDSAAEDVKDTKTSSKSKAPAKAKKATKAAATKKAPAKPKAAAKPKATAKTKAAAKPKAKTKATPKAKAPAKSKAPAKPKAKPKSETAAKKAATPAKSTKKAPPKKAVAEKPEASTSRRKAPTAKPASKPEKQSSFDETPKPKAEASSKKADVKKTDAQPEKKKKRGWWSRRKKD